MTLAKSDFRDLAIRLIAPSQQAGAAILDIYRSVPAISYKSDRSPVTDADHAAESIILNAIAAIAPNVPVIAEEQAAAGNIPEVSDMFFLVDPLDGTKEFLKHNGEFTINIALIIGGRPVFGLIYAPDKSDCYLTLGERVVRFNLEPAHNPPSGTKDLDYVTLSGSAAPARPMTVIVSRSHLRPGTQEFLDRLGKPSMLRMGSSLKFGVLATGEADVYPRFGPTSEWDTAAGHAILNATGGCIRTVDGLPLIYGKSEQGFTNPAFIAWRRESDAASI